MINQLDKIEGIKRGHKLAKLTTFGMGGPADYFYELRDVMNLPELIEACEADGLPWVILGWGSNMIFSDKGFRGLVIHNLAKSIEMDGNLVVADSGALLSQIIQFALKNGLRGMEKMMGLPGTIGGAVRGNAGAFGLETKHIFEKALIYTSGGEVREVGPDYVALSYRHSRLKETGELVLKVWLRLEPGDTAEGVAEVRQIIASRAGKHPQGLTAGSFFKNPSGNSVGEGLSAGLMSDQCGFKGYHVGGAFISEKHANFLMNDGSATMDDVLNLSSLIQDAVLKKYGIRLEREVQLIGEKGKIE
ncbi:UDP-N-acetylmuramate dehydrogenase [Candidatus Peregrinibacteria bacterium]|nr:UDP-N-acetylmuramate dehydrogenase [Candidatus Peregrinibacteria bacterium]